MKSIIISIKPEWVAKILNGEKTIEIRKTAPKCELPVTVYIYCTKGKRDLYLDIQRGCYSKSLYDDNTAYEYATGLKPLNGKVVAKFTLRKISEIENEMKTDLDDSQYPSYFTTEMSEHKLLENSFLTAWEIHNYLKRGRGYAWHIDDLVIFVKPKGLSEFKYEKKKVRLTEKYHWKTERLGLIPVKKAPQSWQYVEEKE